MLRAIVIALLLGAPAYASEAQREACLGILEAGKKSASHSKEAGQIAVAAPLYTEDPRLLEGFDAIRENSISALEQTTRILRLVKILCAPA